MESSSRSKLLDQLALLGSALLLIAVMLGVGIWMANHQISDEWFLGGCMSLVLIGGGGWPFRNKFRNPAFIAFLLVWLPVHLAIFFYVVAEVGFFPYPPVLLLELWIGYTITILFFGQPARKDFH